MQHKFRGPFFFQVCIRIYSSGAVHNAIVEVVSTCSLEPLAFRANFKSAGFFKGEKAAAKIGFELNIQRTFLYLDRAVLFSDGCARVYVYLYVDKTSAGRLASMLLKLLGLWKLSCLVPEVLLKDFSGFIFS